MSWHLDEDLIAAYRNGTVSVATAASLEAHVVACATCRRRVGDATDERRAALNWAAIADRVDEPRRGVAERVLTRFGLREHLARLVVMTPALRATWFTAVVLVSAMAIVASNDRSMLRGDQGSFAFLVLAPLLPVIGVATSFIARNDPAHELTVAAPTPGVELLLVRTAAVLVPSTAISAVGSLALPGDLVGAAVWLLPALGLTGCTLVLARWLPVSFGAGVVSVAWLGAAGVAAIRDSATHLLSHYPPFEPAGQAGFFLLSVAAAASLVALRHTFDFRRTA